METLGSRAGNPVECSGQYVLTGVLLHMFESACPINRAVHGAGLHYPFDNMEDFSIVSVNNVDDPCAAELPGVERLTA